MAKKLKSKTESNEQLRDYTDPTSPQVESHDSAVIPFRDDVVARAKKIWADRGRPEGQDDAIWFEAERQLLNEGAKGTYRGV